MVKWPLFSLKSIVYQQKAICDRLKGCEGRLKGCALWYVLRFALKGRLMCVGIAPESQQDIINLIFNQHICLSFTSNPTVKKGTAQYPLRIKYDFCRTCSLLTRFLKMTLEVTLRFFPFGWVEIYPKILS